MENIDEKNLVPATDEEINECAFVNDVRPKNKKKKS